MLLDCREVPADHAFHTQICIIGSGPVGCALAQELAAKGLQVVVVEAGNRAYDPAAQATHWSADVREPEHHPPLHLWRRRMLGGTSTVWGGRCLPFARSDFDAWGSSWPIEYEDFAAYLPRAAEFLEIGTSDFDARTALMPEDRPFLNGFRHGDLDVEAIDRHSAPTNVTTRYWNEAKDRRNILLLMNAPCTEIRLDPSGSRADCAIIAPSTDRRCRVHASSFVVAAGGLETARLLLASNRDRERGLGNENDLVGRYYMTHFVGNLGRLSTDASMPSRALSFVRTADGVYAKRTLQVSGAAKRREGIGAFVLRPSIGQIGDPGHGSAVLSAIYLTRFLLKDELAMNMARRSHCSSGDYLGHARNVARGIPSIMSFAHEWFVARPRQDRKLPGYDFRRRDSTYPLEYNSEQFPNRLSRVALGGRRDPLGVPLLFVDWRTCDEDRRTVRRGFDLVRSAVAGSGRARILCDEAELERATEELWPAGGHHIGTARWSSSPRHGVVRPDMQVWSVDGLYVAGTAIFPRSGTANPTLSAVATAFRLADCLVARHRS